MKLNNADNTSEIVAAFPDYESVQTYFPTMSLFSRKLNKWSTFNTRYCIVNIDTDSGKATIKDTKRKQEDQTDVFIKHIPIIDSLEYAKRKYLDSSETSLWIPHIKDKAQKLHQKIYSYQNPAYCESLCMVLLSKLVEMGESAHFPTIYGIYNGIKDRYTYNLDNDEYMTLLEEKWFTTAISKKEFSIESIDNDAYGMNLVNVPCQILVMQKFKSTFNSVIKKELEELKRPEFYCCMPDAKIELGFYMWKQRTLVMKFLEKIKAWIFQTCVALYQANTAYNFVHNDLHVENIMMEPTDEQYITYRLDMGRYKVPTFGYIIKIIDYGRAIYTYKRKLYMSEVFDLCNEAGKQYVYIDHNNKRTKVDANPSFDLSRLACSFFEEVNDAYLSPWGSILTLMRSWTFDDMANDVCQTEGFDLYIEIAQNLHRAVPMKQIVRHVFKEYFVQ